MDRAALVVATAALIASATALWTRPSPAPCPCAEQPAHRVLDPSTAAADAPQIRRLRDRVDALEAKVAARARKPPRSAPEAESVDPDPAAPDGPTIVEVRAPHPAVTVTAGDGGALAARNVDPALTGQVMFVELRTADGRVLRRPITVPPPD